MAPEVQERRKESTNAEPTEWRALSHGVEVHRGAGHDRALRLLTDDVVAVIAHLHRDLEGERQQLLSTRKERQAEFDRGTVPGYLAAEENAGAHTCWRVNDLPDDLLKRRVEITGPINDTKMVINMLSRNDAGVRADAAMLDFEDSMKPTWDNVMQGVENLIGAAAGTLTFEKKDADGNVLKRYALDPDDTPLLMARCRGLHLDESNLRVDGTAVSGGLLDLTLSALHTAPSLMSQGKTPKYYVPKVEHFLEARWWNRLFRGLEEALSVPRGTLRTTFLIETLPAAFQIEEILYELRERAAGLNVGRWDKIFSDIKVLKEHPDRVLADRASISLNRPWMKAYAELLIKTCHKHGAFAMGGMAAFTPGKTPEAREQQTRKVVEDKEFEFSLGHDGCWVSHPYFIGPALSSFPADNQLERIPNTPDKPDLLPAGGGPRTEQGLRTNARVGIGYMHGWHRDIGCVAWDDLMEDLATLEISRAQVWQWLQHQVMLDDGQVVTRELVAGVFQEEFEKIANEVREALSGLPETEVQAAVEAFDHAHRDACTIFTEESFRPFLSLRSELVGEDRE